MEQQTTVAPSLERIRVERPRERYKNKYITFRGYCVMLLGVIAVLMGIIIYGALR